MTLWVSNIKSVDCGIIPIIVTLLGLNDSLNALFIRYDRHMKNRQAVLQGGATEPAQQDTTDVVPDLMATTDLMTATATDVTPTASTTTTSAAAVVTLQECVTCMIT